jgi:chromosome segregation ATPase
VSAIENAARPVDLAVTAVKLGRSRRTRHERAKLMPTYQDTINKYESDLKRMADDIKRLNKELQDDRKAIAHAEQQIEILGKALPRFEKEKNKDKIKSTKATIAKHQKDIKPLIEANRKRKTTLEVLQRKQQQLSGQVAKFKHEQRNRPAHENVPDQIMKEWEQMYFPLLKKLDLGLGDTVKKLDKMIAARAKTVAALKAESEKLDDEMQVFIVQGHDHKSKEISTRKDRMAKISGERIAAEDQAKILTARRDEYKAEKEKLKTQLSDKTITKEKYQRAKARLQAVLKFDEGR